MKIGNTQMGKTKLKKFNKFSTISKRKLLYKLYFENKISSFIQKLPWNTADLFKSISQGKDMSQLPQDELICGDLLPRLSYYLQVRRNYYKS